MTADRGVAPALIQTCVAAATAAPSVHNTQPWLFRLYAGGVDVFVDRSRRLTALDPAGREMYISVGAAVLNLRIALRARGWLTNVEVTPAGHPDLAARVQVAGPAEITAGVRLLDGAIAARHTNRRPFADRPVPPATITELAAAAAIEGASLLVADSGLRDAVLSLIRTADNRLRADEHYRAELAAWTTPPGLGRRDGVPRAAFGPRDQSGALPLRDMALGHHAATSLVEFEPEPTIVLLYTHGDTPADWLRAGAALQRLWLAATVRGLAATPLTQATEIPVLRDLMTNSAADWVVQTVLRLGYPTGPALPTPRRAVSEVLIGGDTHHRRAVG
jgi:hypothetical protein